MKGCKDGRSRLAGEYHEESFTSKPSLKINVCGCSWAMLSVLV
jgi:hypothetical protein